MRTKNGTIMLLSKCSMCNSKKLKFLKELTGLFSNLKGIKVPILGDLLILNTLF